MKNNKNEKIFARVFSVKPKNGKEKQFIDGYETDIVDYKFVGRFDCTPELMKIKKRQEKYNYEMHEYDIEEQLENAIQSYFFDTLKQSGKWDFRFEELPLRLHSEMKYHSKNTMFATPLSTLLHII